MESQVLCRTWKYLKAARILAGIVLLALIGTFLYLAIPLIRRPLDILQKYLGGLYFSNVLLVVIASALLVGFFYISLSFIYSVFPKRKFNERFWGTILLMSFIVYSGIQMIEACPRRNPWSLKLSKSRLRSLILLTGTIPPNGPPI